MLHMLMAKTLRDGRFHGGQDELLTLIGDLLSIAFLKSKFEDKYEYCNGSYRADPHKNAFYFYKCTGSVFTGEVSINFCRRGA